MINLLKKLKDTLKKDERLVSEDGELLKNKISELALKLDRDMINLVLKDEILKEHFFTQIDEILVFDSNKFMKFVNNKEFLPDSYTTFKNKIGLTVEDRYLPENKEVVLSWVYKDCILEGGMEREDEKRDEVFFNEILAPDEIDRLLDPKAFMNLKRINAKGEHKIIEIKSTDNLIIKGNNLLVLHSLKKRFAGSIKLIYIDPPYNTGDDEFKYNDNFNESSWLTFMKNRLEVARDLLKKDGSIIIQIGDREVSKLRILMDEIFGQNNFINKISVKTRSPSGFKTVNLGVFESAEYLLLYGKNKEICSYNTQYEEATYDTNYCYVLINPDDPPYDWKYQKIDEIMSKEIGFENVKEAKKRFGEKILMEKKADYALRNAKKVFRFTEINIDAGKDTLKAKEESLKKSDKIYIVKREGYDDRIILNGKEITFYVKKIREIDGELKPTNILTNIWTDIAWEGIANEGGVKLKKGKKPEKILRRIIDMTTTSGDIVLDFFMGTGTTCAVAHKMGRQYIGVEQLDYGKNDAITRLRNVIGKAIPIGKSSEEIKNYDITGISKSVNWKGGGDFVYCELMKWNQKYADKIIKAKTTKELLEIWGIIKEKAFLSYKVDVKRFEVDVEEFEELSFENQKRFLIECLDKNQLYVNLSEIDDKDYGVSEEDKELNRKFYGAF
jgi:adenine-specific DNA-methyltransferase